MEDKQYKEGPQGLSRFTDEEDEPPGPSKVQNDGVQFKAPLEGLPRPSEVHNERDEPLGPIEFQDEGGQSKVPYVGDVGQSGPSEIQSEGDGPPHIDHITHNSGPYWKCNFP